MSVPTSPEAADAFAALAKTVRDLPYEDASMNVLMYPDNWQVGVDAGEGIDDLYQWEGSDLLQIVTAARTDLRRLHPSRPSLDQRTDENERRDFLGLVQHLEGHRSRLRVFPLSLATFPDRE